jgi:hypothetical protein
MSLGQLRETAALGCNHCKLLSEAASLFRCRWRHLHDENLVYLVVSRSLVLGSGPPLTHLRWQSDTGDFEELEITISIEVGQHAPEYPQS